MSLKLPGAVGQHMVSMLVVLLAQGGTDTSFLGIRWRVSFGD